MNEKFDCEGFIYFQLYGKKQDNILGWPKG